MALSDRRILEAMEEGSVVIHPFNREQLATSSYDVTLGEYFFREQQPKYNHALYNIWDKAHIEHVWGADKVERAVPAEEAFKKYNFDWDGGIRPDDLVVVLRPGETILAHTQEFIGGKDHVTTMMKARSSLGRSFIEVCKCAGWGDVGYINRWTMEITNNSEHYIIPLVVGRRIAQLVFFETGAIEGADYSANGKYSGTTNLKKLQQEWQPHMMLPRLWNDKDTKKKQPWHKSEKPKAKKPASKKKKSAKK